MSEQRNRPVNQAGFCFLNGGNLRGDCFSNELHGCEFVAVQATGDRKGGIIASVIHLLCFVDSGKESKGGDIR